MRKTIILLIVATTFVLMFSGIAIANNGPHLGGAAGIQASGGFAQDTDACAGCHRAHTSVQTKLLATGDSIYAFCTACHNGTGANANVESGTFSAVALAPDPTVFTDGVSSATHGEAGMGLNGGGFIDAKKYTGLRGRATAGVGQVTSTHTVKGLGGSTGIGTAWGEGLAGIDDPVGGPLETPSEGPGLSMTLECTSCHDPHGSKNSSGSEERYRILKNTVNGQTVGNITSNETGTVKDYTRMDYKAGTSDFCAACHTQYTSTSSIYDAGDTKGDVTRYRHGVDIAVEPGPDAVYTTGNGKTITQNLNEATHIQLPVESPTGGISPLWVGTGSSGVATIDDDDEVVCMSCHQAHGSSATVNNSVLPASSVDATTSTLLRLNNRGVCQHEIAALLSVARNDCLLLSLRGAVGGDAILEHGLCEEP